MKYPDVQTGDLIDILKEPTEPKAEKTATVVEAEPALNHPEPNPDDFEPKTEPESQIPQTDSLNNPLFEQPQPQVQVKPRLTEKEYEDQAELTIAMFDGIQTLTLPWLYQKSIFTKEELKQLKDLNERYKKPEVELSESDQKLMNRYVEYKQLCDQVPFTPQEVDLLKTPLAKVYSKYNIQLGPEFMLLGALATVMTPRLMPLFSKLERL